MYDRWLESPYQEADMSEEFHEWMEGKFVKLKVEFNGETLYCDGEYIFYVSEIDIDSDREWDYNKVFLDEENLYDLIVTHLKEGK